MIRTQIYLPEEVHRALKEKAHEEKITLAEVIRRSVEKNIKPKREKAKLRGAEVLLKIAEMAEKGGWIGPKDLSLNMDRYLYGDKSSEWDYLYKKRKSGRTK